MGARAPLRQIWKRAERPCAVLLKPVLAMWIESLRRSGEMLDETAVGDVLRTSARTMTDVATQWTETRVLESADVPEQDKARVRALLAQNDPLMLLRRIESAWEKLRRIQARLARKGFVPGVVRNAAGGSTPQARSPAPAKKPPFSVTPIMTEALASFTGGNDGLIKSLRSVEQSTKQYISGPDGIAASPRK